MDELIERLVEAVLRNPERAHDKLAALLPDEQPAPDSKLFNQLLRASVTMDEDIRLGKLHSIEEAFGEPQ